MMLRSAAPLTLFLAAALTASAFAQTDVDTPHKHNATMHKSTPMTFTNPALPANSKSMTGQGCIGQNANAGQTAINPITGKPQAATIVAIPVTNGSGTVASATTRSQQTTACAHGH
jgi:hypothetical protein